MTDDRTRSSGTNERRRDNKAAESTTADDLDVTALAAENRALRERVDELETALTEIHDRLDDSTAQDGSGESTDQQGTATATDAEGTPPLVTSGGQDCKVIGEFDSSGGIGVYGHNQATTGTATGVKGETNSSDNGATAVRGEATASTGETYGVFGTVPSPEGNGVVGSASSGDPDSLIQPIGVYGYTDRSFDSDGLRPAGYGVVGFASLPDASTGTAHGVVGTTTSEDEDSYGVLSLDDAGVSGDLETGGNAEVGGDLYTNADGDRTSRLLFGDTSNPAGRLVHDDVEDTFSLTTNAKVGDIFEIKMDVEVNQDTTSQRTSGPIAKGFINSDATIANGVNIDSVSWTTTANGDFYEIALTDVTFDDPTDYAVQVTPNQSTTSTPLAVRTNFSGVDNLTVGFENDSQTDFSLVVWELPDGTETT